MYDFTRLAALIAVSETGSISRAAARLGYTPPALSQQLAKLEREVGMTLLIRSSKGAELTPAGDKLVGYARRIMETLDEARSGLAEIAGLTKGRLRIGSFTTAAVHLFPEAILHFRRKHPQIHVSLHEFEPPYGVDALVNRDIDLLVTHVYEYGPEVEPTSGVTTATLMTEELLLVTSPEHPLAQETEPLPWQELARWPLITGSRGFANREALEALFAGASLDPPNIAFETGNYAMACSLTGDGSAVALIPEMVLTDLERHQVIVRRLGSPGLGRRVLLAWRTADTPAGLESIRTLLTDSCARYARPAPEEQLLTEHGG